MTIFDGFDADGLQVFAEGSQLSVSYEGWDKFQPNGKERARTEKGCSPSSPCSPSSLARCARPLVQAKMEAIENRKAREKVILVYQTLGEQEKAQSSTDKLLPLLSPHRWGWWRSPSPAGVAGSDGSPCRGRPPTRWSCRPGRRGRWSSFPGFQTLERRNEDETFPHSSFGVSQTLSFLPLTLRNTVGLDVTVVVLAGPNETALRLQHLGDHVVDQAMLVPEALGFKLAPVLSAQTKKTEGRNLQFHNVNYILRGACSLETPLKVLTTQ